jgi:electron transfer flavoprotein alpha subunit
VAVLVEPDRDRPNRELLSLAARLSTGLAERDGETPGATGAAGARVVAVGPPAAVGDPETLAAWGADEVVAVEPASGSADDLVEEDVAAGLAAWAGGAAPWAVLAPSTAWGREVAARAAAALGAGLTGDAVGLGVTAVDAAGADPADAAATVPAVPAGAADPGPRLVAWKPAFGGGLLAAVHCRSPIQMATVRPGVAGTFRPRPAAPPPRTAVVVAPRRRVAVHAYRREDDVADLLQADVVVGVGQGVEPGAYGELDDLLSLLGAHLGATRKVTDQGWLPHARQIGITGASIAPRLFVSLGASGKFNHLVGVRAAGTVLAVNPDPGAPVFAASDVGIVGDWRVVVPRLVRALRAAGARRPAPAASGGDGQENGR